MYLRDKLLYEIDILNKSNNLNQYKYYTRDMIALLEKYSWNAEMLYIIARKLNNVDIEYLQQLLLNTGSAKYLYLFALEGYKGINYNLITEVICNTQDIEYMFKMAKYISKANYKQVIQTLVSMKRFDVIKLLEVRNPIVKRKRIINKMVKLYTKDVKFTSLKPQFDIDKRDCVFDKIL